MADNGQHYRGHLVKPGAKELVRQVQAEEAT
jgi:hypothetical protein